MAAFIAKVEKVKVDDDPTAPAPKLENYGLVKPMPRKEYHHNTPQLAKMLHKAIRDGPGGVDQYELFSQSLSEAPVKVYPHTECVRLPRWHGALSCAM